MAAAAPLRPRPGMPRAGVPRPGAGRKVIPFDYSFRFQLRGRPFDTHREKVVVSSEGQFTAVSIGYGMVLQNPVVTFGPSPVDFPSPPPPVISITGAVGAVAAVSATFIPTTLADVTFGNMLVALNRVLGTQGAEVIRSGFRLNPALAERALLANGASQLDAALVGQLFQVFVPPAEQVQFLYALFDDGSGRAFQSDPVLNIAGLGDAGGERPFRHFATPITFEPLATIRMEITEVTTQPADLFVSLHGYKVLGGAGTPTGRALRRARRRR